MSRSVAGWNDRVKIEAYGPKVNTMSLPNRRWRATATLRAITQDSSSRANPNRHASSGFARACLMADIHSGLIRVSGMSGLNGTKIVKMVRVTKKRTSQDQSFARHGRRGEGVDTCAGSITAC